MGVGGLAQVGQLAGFDTLLCTWFVGLVGSTICLRKGVNFSRTRTSPAAQPHKEGHNQQPGANASFRQFQWRYLVPYLFATSADWLKGPYIYAIYQDYGYPPRAITVLFCVGYIAGALVGLPLGNIADCWGRRRMCMVYGLAQVGANVCATINYYPVLVIGRVCSGLATAALSTSFESWMVGRHYNAGFSKEQLSDTFAQGTFLNGCVAVVSGLLGQAVTFLVGPRGAFGASALCSVCSLGYCWTHMEESYGDSRSSFLSTLKSSLWLMGSDPVLRNIALLQTLFESSMYLFVLQWTPMLNSSAGEDRPIPHGLVFANFMLCVMVGSNLFNVVVKRKQTSPADAERRLHAFVVFLFVCASAALGLLLVLPSYPMHLACLFAFEVCCGMYFPSLGMLRALHIPEARRAGLSSCFRIPLNLVVVSTMLAAKTWAPKNVFALASVLLLTGSFVMLNFSSSSLEASQASPYQPSDGTTLKEQKLAGKACLPPTARQGNAVPLGAVEDTSSAIPKMHSSGPASRRRSQRGT